MECASLPRRLGTRSSLEPRGGSFFEDQQRRGSAWDYGRVYFSVEGYEPALSFDREREEIVVGEVFCRGKYREGLGVGHRKIVGPELVAGAGQVVCELRAHGLWSSWPSGEGGRADDAKQSIFCNGAGGPAFGLRSGKESNGQLVQGMVLDH